MNVVLDEERCHAVLRGWDRFTPSEFRILEYAAEGLTSVQIGERFGIGLSAVKWHRGRMFRKIGARNMAHAVALAYQAGMIR